MAILGDAEIIATQLWPQGDIRDPLGVWGARLGVTGDASGGSIKVGMQASAGINAAYIYTVYNLNFSQLTGTGITDAIGVRLLSNWPDADPAVVGVQGFGSHIMTPMVIDPTMTPPISAPGIPLVGPNDRFLLLFDPRPGAGTLIIVEMEFGNNVDTVTYTFEGYGYFWDRSVLQAPGGLRHPGSS